MHALLIKSWELLIYLNLANSVLISDKHLFKIYSLHFWRHAILGIGNTTDVIDSCKGLHEFSHHGLTFRHWYSLLRISSRKCHVVIEVDTIIDIVFLDSRRSEQEVVKVLFQESVHSVIEERKDPEWVKRGFAWVNNNVRYNVVVLKLRGLDICLHFLIKIPFN